MMKEPTAHDLPNYTTAPPANEHRERTSRQLLAGVLRELRRLRKGAEAQTAELLTAGGAAGIAGVSLATWHRLNAAAKLPAAVKVGTAGVRWRRADVLAWIRWGCPPRDRFEALQRQGGGK